jgi:hypothetical protein
VSTVIKNFGPGGTLTLGTGPLETICQVLNCEVSGSNTRQDINTACGVVSSYINETFSVRIRYLQDWSTGGISTFLDLHYNTYVAFTFSPDTDGLPKRAGNLLCPRPMMGGDSLVPMIDDQTCPAKDVVTTSGS